MDRENNLKFASPNRIVRLASPEILHEKNADKILMLKKLITAALTYKTHTVESLALVLQKSYINV